MLYDAIADLKLDIQLKMASNPGESKNPDLKIKQDVEDLMVLFQLIDEQQIKDGIPLYLITDLDLTPSPRVVEGELSVVMHKPAPTEALCFSLQREWQE